MKLSGILLRMSGYWMPDFKQHQCITVRKTSNCSNKRLRTFHKLRSRTWEKCLTHLALLSARYVSFPISFWNKMSNGTIEHILNSKTIWMFYFNLNLLVFDILFLPGISSSWTMIQYNSVWVVCTVLQPPTLGFWTGYSLLE